MDADLDTLATALYVRSDDLLKAARSGRHGARRSGISPEAQRRRAGHPGGAAGPARVHVSEARWLRFARKQLRGLFPYLPGQSGYNKRLRKLAGTMLLADQGPGPDTSLWADDVWVVDSTPVECGRSKETARRSDLAGWAEYGYCASHSRYFWGLRLHLLTTLHGLPVGFALTGAKADERQVLLAILAADPGLAAMLPGQILIGDKNYYGRDFEATLASAAPACCARPARASPNGRAPSSSNRCARSSNRSTTPSKDNSTSNATAGTPPAASSPGSCSASSP